MPAEQRYETENNLFIIMMFFLLKNHLELRVVVCRGLLECSISAEHNCLHCVEVLMEQVSVLLTPKVPHTLLDTQLDTPHQLRGLELLVGHLTILHSPVSKLLPLENVIFGITGRSVAVGSGYVWRIRLESSTGVWILVSGVLAATLLTLVH